jgi:hypothetical protein
MPLTLRPTGLGSGIDKDRPDYTERLGSVTIAKTWPCSLKPTRADTVRDIARLYGERHEHAQLIRDLLLDDGGPQHRLAQRLQRLSVQRALRGLCDRVGRASTPGKPWLRRLKAPAAESHPRRHIEIGAWTILPIFVTMSEGRDTDGARAPP